MPEDVAQNFTRLARLNLPGGGQIRVSGGYAYVGHMDAPHGTTIVDVSEPRDPKVVARVMLDDPYSHSHKVRVVGDYMIVNHEQNRRHFMRKAVGLTEFVEAHATRHGGDPPDAEIAAHLGVKPSDIPELRAAAQRGYHDGGFRIYDISDRTAPRLLCHKRTHGFGVHRFDADENYLYMSTEMPGYIGNILVVYDFSDPSDPTEIARWWMPEQVSPEPERLAWTGYQRRLHHTLRVGDRLWASCWHAGFRVIDASDIRNMRTIGAADYHPPGHSPTHTVLPLPGRHDGRQYAAVIDEEHSHRKGQLPAHLWIYDVTDPANMQAVSTFHVSERDTPYAGGPGRFGAHQFQEVIAGDVLFAAWFSAGLRAIDLSDPREPVEVGHFIPAPTGGHPAPQSNDVFVDERGIVYLLDRHEGLDILEFEKT